MELWLIILLIALGVLLAVFLFVWLPPFFIAVKIYKDILVRTSKDKWSRKCSMPEDDEQADMYAKGESWASRFTNCRRDVEIENDGLHLYGEYFDFGGKKAVIIIPGRMEGCHYSYFFAQPYQESGFNVLVIDSRAHGLSDGMYNCVGLKEYSDVLAWGRLLHDTFGNETVVCHGVCIGSATSIRALTDSSCPSYMAGMVADGMFETFYEIFKRHLIADKRPVYPFIWEVMFLLRVKAGVNAMANGPVKCVGKLNKPILFLYSREDIFAIPSKGQKLYDKCASPNKRIVWFDHGRHSHIRIVNTEAYDAAVKEFLAETF